MPWLESDAMSQRIKFIQDYLRGEVSMSELCRNYGICRQTGYKWVGRFEDGGFEALSEHSRAPRRHGNQTPEHIEQLIVDARDEHPTWGAKKLKPLLERLHPDKHFPSEHTVHAILKRRLRVRPKPRRQRVPPFEGKLTEASYPNHVWTIDFKGWSRLRNGAKCYPLTIMDLRTRYLLCCVGLKAQTWDLVQPVLMSLFQRFGLPEIIRSDNGTPFATNGIGGLSRLTVLLMRLGIDQERITPGKPTENAKHERMHRTLKAEACRPPKGSFKAQNRHFEDFTKTYNTIRPHEALGQIPPADIYRPSERRLPERIPDFEYPGWFQVRRVNSVGNICLHQAFYYIGKTIEHELIGFEPWWDNLWLIHLGNRVLGMIDEDRLELEAFERRSAKNKKRITRGWIPKSWAERYPRNDP